MKNCGVILLVLITIALTSCWHNESYKAKPNIISDTLTYVYQNIKESATDCMDKPDSSCSTANIKYPVFDHQAPLNDTITHRMAKLFDGDPDKDLNTLAKSFIASYDVWKKAHKNAADHFKLKLNAKVLRQDSSIVTLEIAGSSLAGNKHPITQTRFINWNTKAKNIIQLDSIMIKGYRDRLTTIAEQIFRKQENLKDTSSLARDYFFKGNKFALNNNYLITPIGIRFLYNEYEIKPYNAGKTDLFIPYRQIKTLFKPNTVIKRYIK